MPRTPNRKPRAKTGSVSSSARKSKRSRDDDDDDDTEEEKGNRSPVHRPTKKPKVYDLRNDPAYQKRMGEFLKKETAKKKEAEAKKKGLLAKINADSSFAAQAQQVAQQRAAWDSVAETTRIIPQQQVSSYKSRKSLGGTPAVAAAAAASKPRRQSVATSAPASTTRETLPPRKTPPPPRAALKQPPRTLPIANRVPNGTETVHLKVPIEGVGSDDEENEVEEIVPDAVYDEPLPAYDEPVVPERVLSDTTDTKDRFRARVWDVVAALVLLMAVVFGFTSTRARWMWPSNLLPVEKNPIKCFENSVGATTNESWPSECAIAARTNLLLNCPKFGVCHGGRFVGCENGFDSVRVSTESMHRCELSKESEDVIYLITNLLYRWTVDYHCSANPYVHHVSPTGVVYFGYSQVVGELDGKVAYDPHLIKVANQWYPSPRFSLEMTDDLRIGLLHVSLPFTCQMSKLMASTFSWSIESARMFLSFILSAFWHAISAFWQASWTLKLIGAAAVVILGLLWARQQRQAEKTKLTIDVSTARMKAMEMLQNDPRGEYRVLFVRDTVKEQLGLMDQSPRVRRRFDLEVWKEVEHQLNRDNRVRIRSASVGGQMVTLYKWDTGSS